MKQIKEPILPHVSTSSSEDIISETDSSKLSKSKLGPIQKDRSYLPNSSDKPVHKCGCT